MFLNLLTFKSPIYIIILPKAELLYIKGG